MQIAVRQQIFDDVASLAECASPKHRARADEIVSRVKERLNPSDGRQSPRTEAHRAKIAAAFELRRETEIFTVEDPETGQTAKIVGISNLVQATGYTLGSIRVRFSMGRGRFPFSYKGADFIAVRTESHAEAPDNGWQKAMNKLARA